VLILLAGFGVSVLFSVGPFSHGTLVLYVGDDPEGLFTQQGSELYHWPKSAHEQRVTLSLSPGTYVYVAGEGACSPNLSITVSSGKTFDEAFIPVAPTMPGGDSNAKCYPLWN
jgi:hypothetical protein